MNWAAISFDWNQIRAFWATAEEGSFSAAARALSLAQPTLGRQVAGLEEALGVTLFERVGRGLVLTEAGRGLLEYSREMGEAAHRVSLAASGLSQAVEGMVRITASDVMCAWVLPTVVAELRAIAPGLEIDLVADNAISDLMRRDADVALRHVRPDEPDLIARLVEEATARPYAATGYLEARGRPSTPQELAQLDFIAFGERERMVSALNAWGIPVTKASFRTGSASGAVAWELVRQGLGVAVMSDDVASRTPGVEPALPGFPPVTFPVWLVTHRELHTSARIRLVFDHLARTFSDRRG